MQKRTIRKAAIIFCIILCPLLIVLSGCDEFAGEAFRSAAKRFSKPRMTAEKSIQTASPASAAPSCVDSDGVDVSVRGNVRADGQTYYDTCASEPGKVYEYICMSDGRMRNQLKSCAAGMLCEDGRCVTSAPACVDSDGGQEFGVAGVLAVGGEEFEDHCGSDGDFIVEYYCNAQGGRGTTNSRCSYKVPGSVCVDGACIVACTDSDGSDPLVKGHVTDSDATYYDECYATDDGRVLEYTCHNNMAMGTGMDCAVGMLCDDGRCVVAEPEEGSNCVDSDGEDTSTKGSVLDKDGYLSGGTPVTYYDECAADDPDVVVEKICLSATDQPYTKRISCGAGKRCSAGRCVAVPCVDSDGENKFVKGNVYDATGTHYDDCSPTNSNYVVEKICYNNKYLNKALYCGSGYTCSSGKCVSTTTAASSSLSSTFTAKAVEGTEFADCVSLYGLGSVCVATEVEFQAECAGQGVMHTGGPVCLTENEAGGFCATCG